MSEDEQWFWEEFMDDDDDILQQGLDFMEYETRWYSEDTEEEKKYLQEVQREMVKSGRQHSKPVKCIETGVIYFSARQTGSGNTHIADVCVGKRNICNGYHWEWCNDID